MPSVNIRRLWSNRRLIVDTGHPESLSRPPTEQEVEDDKEDKGFTLQHQQDRNANSRREEKLNYTGSCNKQFVAFKETGNPLVAFP